MCRRAPPEWHCIALRILVHGYSHCQHASIRRRRRSPPRTPTCLLALLHVALRRWGRHLVRHFPGYQQAGEQQGRPPSQPALRAGPEERLQLSSQVRARCRLGLHQKAWRRAPPFRPTARPVGRRRGRGFIVLAACPPCILLVIVVLLLFFLFLVLHQPSQQPRRTQPRSLRLRGQPHLSPPVAGAPATRDFLPIGHEHTISPDKVRRRSSPRHVLFQVPPLPGTSQAARYFARRDQKGAWCPRRREEETVPATGSTAVQGRELSCFSREPPAEGGRRGKGLGVLKWRGECRSDVSLWQVVG